MPPQTEQLDQYVQQAEAAFAVRDFQAAERNLIAALDRQPQRSDLLFLLGHTHLERQEFETALRCYDDVSALQPGVAEVEASRALALQLLGRSAEAQTAAQNALKKNATSLLAMKVLARIHLDAGRHDLARKYCGQVLNVNAADPEGLSMLSQCRPECVRPVEQPSAPVVSPPVLRLPAEGASQNDAELKQLLQGLLEKVGFRRLQKVGFHLQRNDYYSPLNDCDFLEANRDVWQKTETPADINWNLDGQLEVAREIARYLGELQDVPLEAPTDASVFAWKNCFWENADALVHYGLVRSRRPARYVEIGCGWSSLLLKRALARNAQEGCFTEVTLIEPYPNPRLFKHFPPEWKIHRSMIQRASFAIFDQLEAGDVLFYDGSHCSKVGSDVNWFFFKILPRIKPGVIIHIHDISLPNEYPDPWIFERGQTWNEQYVLQAFLMHNNAYKILIGNRYLFCNRRSELEQLYGATGQPVYGSSFWMQKTEDSVPTQWEKNGGKLQQSSVNPAPLTKLTDVLGMASAALAREDQATARTLFATARRQKPDRAEDALMLGYLALNLGDSAAALDSFTQAVQLSPADAFSHSSRALVLQLLNRSSEAVREAEMALTLDKHAAVALKVLAQIQLNSGRPNEALASCRRILERQPNDADARRIEREAALARTPIVTTTAPVPVIRGKLDGLLGDYAARCETWQNLGVEHLLQQYVVGDFKKSIESYPAPKQLPCGKDGLPVPPAELTMGYGAGNLNHYLDCGDTTYRILNGLIRSQRISLEPGDAMLDWGCAAGRVVRKFINEARLGCEVWGCDVHAPSIQWAQNHLSPPFKFFNSSALPHLPFADGTFKFIYGMSVMTHMVALRDLWLLELRRVLHPDGCLILTVHNESTWDWFRQRGMPAWMPKELHHQAEMPGEVLEIRGSRWEHVYTFFRSSYLRRVWGQHLNICEIVDCADSYQAAVVMKKS